MYKIYFLLSQPKLHLNWFLSIDSSVPEGKLNCKETFWWEGIQIVPPNHQKGLLDSIKEKLGLPKQQVTVVPDDSPENSSDDNSSSDSMLDSIRSEEELKHKHKPPPTMPIVSPKKVSKRKKVVGNLWQVIIIITPLTDNLLIKN